MTDEEAMAATEGEKPEEASPDPMAEFMASYLGMLKALEIGLPTSAASTIERARKAWAEMFDEPLPDDRWPPGVDQSKTMARLARENEVMRIALEYIHDGNGSDGTWGQIAGDAIGRVDNGAY
jgi:hypothetical protein